LSERLLVNHFYAPPVGHAVEALHYANGHHRADPAREVAVAWNAATATELAALCPFVHAAYAIEHPFNEPCGDSTARLAGLPRAWDWVCDDPRRHQEWQTDLFAGMRDYYAASDAHLDARLGRTIEGSGRASYLPHQPLRFVIPDGERAVAAQRLDGADGPFVAVMPAGGSERSRYPSVASWLMLLDGLAEALPDARFVLLGRLTVNARTRTGMDAADVRRLLDHRSAPIDAFDLRIVQQLALVERCAFFLAPHTGFGLAALAVGTPWLALSGGPWFEYWFNHVPFRSILPAVERYPCFSRMTADDYVQEPEGVVTASMSKARFADDLPRIVEAARELAAGTLTYEQALADYFPALLAAHGGDASALWSIDGVHAAHL
jgi:hypothetical protein